MSLARLLARLLAVAFALAGSARAEPAAEGLPALDASSPVLAVDGEHAVLVPDTAVHAPFAARMDLQRAQDPLVLRELDGDTHSVLRGVWQLDLAAAWGWRRLRIAGTAPVILRHGDAVDGGSALGDPGLQAKVALRPGGPDRVGLAALLGGTLPLSGASRALGSPGATGHAGLVLDAAPGPAWLGLSGAVVAGPRTTDRGLTQDDALDLRAAIGLGLGGGNRLALEGRTRTDLREPWAEAATSPTELLLSAHHARPGGLRLRAGLGAGLVPGVGAPAWRLLLGVGHQGASP